MDGFCTPGGSFKCGVWPVPRSTDSTHDPNCTGRLKVMVRVSPQGHTKKHRPTDVKYELNGAHAVCITLPRLTASLT